MRAQAHSRGDRAKQGRVVRQAASQASVPGGSHHCETLKLKQQNLAAPEVCEKCISPAGSTQGLWGGGIVGCFPFVSVFLFLLWRETVYEQCR